MPLARLLLPVFPAIRLPEGLTQALPEEVTAGELWLRAPDMALAGPDRQGAGADLLAMLPELLVLLWGTVAAALALRAVWRYVRCLRALEWESRPAGKRVQAVYGDACRMLEVTRPPRLLVCPGLRSPMQAGLLRPMVLLPDENSGEAVLRAALLHELTHYRRLDLCSKWLAEAAVCVHWFNPLVYVLRRELSRACELSCDEGVLRRLDESGRKVYGASLIALARPVSGPTKNNMTLAMSRDGEQLKERLYAIMKFQSKGKLTGAAAVGVAAALCLCGVLAGACAADLTGQAEESRAARNAGHLGAAGRRGADEARWSGRGRIADLSPGRRHPDGDHALRHPGAPHHRRDHQPRRPGHPGGQRRGGVPPPGAARCWSPPLTRSTATMWSSAGTAGRCSSPTCPPSAVAEGDQVTQGQNVGYVGQTGMATGPHLHVEVRLDGALADPETCFYRRHLCPLKKKKPEAALPDRAALCCLYVGGKRSGQRD